MPATRQDRTPERTDGIAVELTEFGLWIEVHRDGGGWDGIFLSARALRRLVALPPDERLTALATLDPAIRTAHRRGVRRQAATDDPDDQPGAA